MKKIIIIFVIILFSSCTGLMQRAGEALDGNAFNEKTTALYRVKHKDVDQRFEIRKLSRKNGDQFLEIRGEFFPGLVLRGSMPEADGAFDITEAEFLATHINGWNQITLELMGSATLHKDGSSAKLDYPAPAEMVQVTSGRIRLKGSRISGSDALKFLRNRRERIIAVNEWMAENADVPLFNSQDEYEAHWKPVLFPEMFSKNNKPPGYSIENAIWQNDGDIKWNTTYTEAIFPEWLWELRNTGALLRDWEEASSWFYLEYNWDKINSVFDGIILKQE